MILYFAVPHQGSIRHEVSAFAEAARAVMRAKGGALLYCPVCDRPTMSCRNRIVHDFLASPGQVLLSMDHDCVPCIDGVPDTKGLLRALETLERDDVDVLAGWSLILREQLSDLVPCVARAPGPDDGRPGRWPIDFVSPYDPAGLVDITGGSFGTHCFFAKRRVFEGVLAARRIWFEDIFERDPASPDFGCRKIGHDFAFSQLCADLGFRVWLDNRMFWGHRKDVDLRWVHDSVRSVWQRLQERERELAEANEVLRES